MIACIGWGSLIWSRRKLDLDGNWRADGPLLPVEFARQSSHGRITLVLEEAQLRIMQLLLLAHPRWAGCQRNSRCEVEDRDGVGQRAAPSV
jgi:hypothetical protein